ncbi:hypothetical protein ACUR5C_03870 [Aliikangiella sp. IMCC44653]
MANQQRANTQSESMTDSINSPWTDKTTHKLHESVDKVASKASVAESSLRDAAAKSKENVTDKSAQLQSQLKASADQAKTIAKKNPLATAGIAFAAGVLVSSLLSRRS